MEFYFSPKPFFPWKLLTWAAAHCADEIRSVLNCCITVVPSGPLKVWKWMKVSFSSLSVVQLLLILGQSIQGQYRYSKPNMRTIRRLRFQLIIRYEVHNLLVVLTVTLKEFIRTKSLFMIVLDNIRNQVKVENIQNWDSILQTKYVFTALYSFWFTLYRTCSTKLRQQT